MDDFKLMWPQDKTGIPCPKCETMMVMRMTDSHPICPAHCGYEDLQFKNIRGSHS